MLEEALERARILRSLVVGALVGLLTGFTDSYGYAVSGYTVSEIELVVAPIMARILLGRGSTPREIFIATVAAYGISMSTIITSGMVITYFLTSRIYEIFYRESDFPSWLYSGVEACFPKIFSCSWSYTYLALAALSLGGVGFAYALRHLFLEKLELPYPLGIASALISSMLSKLESYGAYVGLPVLAGFLAGIALLYTAPGGYDLTPIFTSKGVAITLSFSINIIILLIALVLPPRVSASIGAGSLATSLMILPAGGVLGIFPVIPGTGSDVLENVSTWYTASVVFGAVAATAGSVLWSLRSVMPYIARSLVSARSSLALVLGTLATLSGILVLSYLRAGSPGLWFIAAGLVLVLLMIPLLMIITSWAAGEAGTVSQAFYPTSTVYMYLVGYRGFAPYAYMDHYLGIPMPSSLSASSLQILRGAKILGISPSKVLQIFSTFYLLGSLVTIFYGSLLIAAYGNDPSRMPLERWIPYAVWSLSVIKGELDPVAALPGILVGVFSMILLQTVPRLFKQQFSPIPLIIGLTLTPDLGILFTAGSIVRWVFSRTGASAEKMLIITASSALAGAGIAVVAYALLTIAMPGG